MNKSIAILASLVMLGCTASSMAATAAVVNLSNYDADKPIQGPGGATTVDANTYVELLASVDGSTWVPVQIGLDATKTSWKVDDSSGYFDQGVGIIPGAAANATVSFQLHAWVCGSSYTDPNNTLVGEIGPWSQATGSWVTDQQPAATPNSVALNIPGSIQLHSVPEPSTIALGLLGACALLIRRRK